MCVRRPGEEIKFENAVNFRELGGYKGDGKRTVKYGCFYRGGKLWDIQSNTDMEKLTNLNLKVILDLRSHKEAQLYPDPNVSKAKYYNICALLEEDGSEMEFSPNDIEDILNSEEGVIQGLNKVLFKMYGNMPFNNQAFIKLFQEIESNHVPILFHCTSGKDRTGVAAMLVLLALGVSEEDILKDYELTNLYRKEKIKHIIEINKEEIEKNPDYIKVYEVAEGVSIEAGKLVLQRIKAKYGTYENYFSVEFGLSHERIKTLRDQYLE